MNNKNRFEEQSNLLRSHYYLLKTPYTPEAIPLIFQGSTVYLHKDFRGFSAHKFTHQDFKSIIKVLGMRYFKIHCLNLKGVIKNYQNFDDCMTYKIKKTNLNGNVSVLSKKNKLKLEYELLNFTKPTFQNFNIDEIIERSISLFGILNLKIIESNDDLLFNYNNREINIIHYFEYFNHIFNINISTILQNPITSVFIECVEAFELYKINKDIEGFIDIISPSSYDFMITNIIFKYIKNIDCINDIFINPIYR